MLSFQGQVMESIFIDSICGLVFLDEWFYLSNRSINCVNFGTSLNLVHSNLGGSKQSRMLRAINQEDALYICNDHTLIYVWFYFKLWYGMYILTCLKSISLSWGDVVSYQQTCSENNSCWSSGAYDSWYWALLFMTNILILMQYEYLSAEEACRWCFSEWEGMYYVKCWPWCGVNKINWLGKVNCYPMCCILVSGA